jgi:hypothetical protein
MTPTKVTVGTGIEWMQKVADLTSKARERPSMWRRILECFRNPNSIDVWEDVVNCIEFGVEHSLEEKLRVTELVALLNSAQALRQQFLQCWERFNMNREGDLAAMYEMSVGRRCYPKENDWENRLKAVVRHLLFKYASIFQCCAIHRVGDLAMTCGKIEANAAFDSDDLAGDIVARLDDSTDFGALHSTTLRNRRDPARSAIRRDSWDSCASAITLVETIQLQAKSV